MLKNMRTKLKTAHEEEYSDKSRIIGVLLNYSIDDDWKDSLIYLYRKNTYIFFNTIIDTIDYLLYGDNKVKRAYMEEKDFDNYWDAEYIEGTFTEKLKWQ
jgi:hypothetical protein